MGHPLLRSARRILSLLAIPLVAGLAPLHAQGVEDAMLLPKHMLAAGASYTYDSWDHYWEGTLERTNGNIGTVTTRTATFAVAGGVTDRLTVVGMLPYVWTRATQGTLRGLSGAQDFQVAAKYRLLAHSLGQRNALSVLAVIAAATPASDYTPDFLPLSIGLASRRLSTRLTASVARDNGWFVSGSAAHTWRANVHLDREAYYTNGQLYPTNEVQMPRLFDWSLTTGFHGGRLMVPITVAQQRTQGGGDIRRQDMPFVSNRMDFTRIDAGAAYALRVPRDVTIRLGLGRVLDGRNVGQSTTFTSGVMYAFHF